MTRDYAPTHTHAHFHTTQPELQRTQESTAVGSVWGGVERNKGVKTKQLDN